MERTEKRRSRFGIGLLIYCMIFMIVGVLVLIYFYDWLGEYEASRPTTAIASFQEDLSGPLPEELVASLSEVDRQLQSEAEIEAFVRSLLGRAQIVRSSTQSTQSTLKYLIRADKNTIGTLTLEQTGEQKLGFQGWSITGQSYDLSSYYTTASVTVPETYSVLCSSVPLDRRYITEEGIPYKLLEAYYDDLPSLPRLIRYTSGIRLGESSLDVFDAQGNPISEEDMNEKLFLSNSSSRDEDSLAALTREFITNYVQFTANVDGGFYYYFTLVRQMVVPESSLYERLGQSIGSFGFTTTRSCDIIRDSVNFCSRLDDTHYLVDYTYTTQTRSSDGDAEDTRNVRLLITDTGDRRLILTMNNY